MGQHGRSLNVLASILGAVLLSSAFLADAQSIGINVRKIHASIHACLTRQKLKLSIMSNVLQTLLLFALLAPCYLSANLAAVSSAWLVDSAAMRVSAMLSRQVLILRRQEFSEWLQSELLRSANSLTELAEGNHFTLKSPLLCSLWRQQALSLWGNISSSLLCCKPTRQPYPPLPM